MHARDAVQTGDNLGQQGLSPLKSLLSGEKQNHMTLSGPQFHHARLLNQQAQQAQPFQAELTSATSGLARGVSDALQGAAPPVTDIFTQKALIWSSRAFVGDRLDDLGTRISRPTYAQLAQDYRQATQSNSALAVRPFSYGELLHLNRATDIDIKRLLKGEMKYWDTVSKNFEPLRQRIRAAISGEQKFFKPGFTPGKFLKETVVKNNINPIREGLAEVRKGNFTGTTNKSGIFSGTGSAVARMFGLGLLGLDIFKTTRTAWRANLEKEKAGEQNRTQTILETGKTFLMKSAKNIISWEVAGLGLAIGAKLLPGITFGSVVFPLGGILFGAGLAALTTAGLNKLFPDPQFKKEENPPDNQSSQPASGNPFAADAVRA